MKYTATFADGTAHTRNSEHEYTVAWRATWVSARNGQTIEKVGFSRDEVSANPYRPVALPLSRGISSNERARRHRENAATLQALRYAVEFAPAIAQE